MVVTVRLFASFQQGRFDEAPRECHAGTCVGDIVDELRIPRQEIGVLLVNRRHAGFDRELSPGDVMSVFPLIGGG
jgi:molybdopterin converting factor small subunit